MITCRALLQSVLAKLARLSPVGRQGTSDLKDRFDNTIDTT